MLVKQFRALCKKACYGNCWLRFGGLQKFCSGRHASKPHALIKRNNQTKSYENKRGKNAEMQKGLCLPGKLLIRRLVRALSW